MDIPVEHFTLEAMKYELICVFKISNKDQIARRQLRNLRKLMSVDNYAAIFPQTFYSCVDITQAKAKASFIEELKPDTRLYVEEIIPINLNAAILLA